jgi:hypothetical protein
MTDRDERPGQGADDAPTRTKNRSCMRCGYPLYDDNPFTVCDDCWDALHPDSGKDDEPVTISTAESAAVAALVAAVEAWIDPNTEPSYRRAMERASAALADPALARWRAVRTGEEGPLP